MGPCEVPSPKVILAMGYLWLLYSMQTQHFSNHLTAPDGVGKSSTRGEIIASSSADKRNYFALDQHSWWQIRRGKRMPSGTRMRIGEHRQPFFVELGSQGAIL